LDLTLLNFIYTTASIHINKSWAMVDAEIAEYDQNGALLATYMATDRGISVKVSRVQRLDSALMV
jgi:hypothetical protein